MNIMQENINDVHSMDDVLDQLYGKVGSAEREEFRKSPVSVSANSVLGLSIG